MTPRGFQKLGGAHNVGVHKRARVVNGTIDMGFGSKVHDPKWAVLAEDGIHAAPVADVAFRKRKARILCDGFQAAQVPGVGELIQNHYIEFGFRQRQSDEVAPNEPCTTRHDNCAHASSPFACCLVHAAAPMRALVQELVPEPGKISATPPKIVPEFCT